MKNISMIASIGKNLELGKNNQLIWPIKEDLKFFREQTMGKPIIMGRKTLESLPKLLPGRRHIVLTSSNIDNSEIVVVHSKEELLEFIRSYQDEVMVIGGASIYHQLLEEAHKLILTEVDAEDKDADSYFPSFNKDEWDREVISSYDEHNPSYKHLVYTRKK